MGLTDDLLAMTPASATGGRRAVCVVCPEIAAEVDGAVFLVVAVPGARVLRPDGDVARAVALAAASVGGAAGPAQIVVVGHENCVFRSPSFGVPGPTPQGESFATIRDLVRHSVVQLAESPWLHPSGVSGVVTGSGAGLETVVGAAAAGLTAPTARPAPAREGSAQYSAGPSGLGGSGPVSFFSGAGAPSSLADVVGPTASGAVRWDAPPPIAPGGVTWESPEAMSVSSVGPTGSPARMPTVGPMPTVSAEMPQVTVPPPPEPLSYQPPPSLGLDTSGPSIDVTRRPPPPPPPRAAPPRRGPPPPPPPPRGPPPAQGRPRPSGDDPFARAEEILERLRREKRR